MPAARWGRGTLVLPIHLLAWWHGSTSNQAESYFSRLRRAEIGQHHDVSGKYLGAYAVEIAWHEDNRRTANGALYQAATGAALGHPVSRVWAGYWQRAMPASADA